MARFLSPEWFAQLAAERGADGPCVSGEDLVVEQVVTGTPDGDVRYRVRLSRMLARVDAGGGGDVQDPPDLAITCDWATASAMAQGELSAQVALMQGRLRVRGSLAGLPGRSGELVGLDALPAAVRDATTY